MHWIQALVARKEVLADISITHPTAVVRQLPQGYCLVPLTNTLLASVGANDLLAHDPASIPAEDIPPGVRAYAAQTSANGPVAFIATYIYGGTGGQDAVVWHGGKIVARFHEDEELMSSWPDSSISKALRRMGVIARPNEDEFDALGLGTHRSTEAWAEDSEEIQQRQIPNDSTANLPTGAQRKAWWRFW